jgi:sec-independent protein translocase protein TatC
MSAALAYKHEPEPEEPQPGPHLPFLDHLEELRTRIIRSAIAVGVGMLVAWAFIGRLVAFVLHPVLKGLPPGAHLIYTQPGEGFAFDIEVALIAGGIIAAPYVCAQLWFFIAPALYAREKRLAVPFIAISTAGVAAGAAFAHFVAFPYMMVFFGTFASPDLMFMPRLEDAFELYTHMVIGMCLVFQMPTLIFFLARMRLVTARFLMRHFKYAVLVIFIAAAVITPSADPWNQTVLAVPMLALYAISIAIAWAVAPRAR